MRIVPAPDDLVSWFAWHPGFVAELAQPVTVGGIVGQSIEVNKKGLPWISTSSPTHRQSACFGWHDGQVVGSAIRRPGSRVHGFARSPQVQEALPILEPVIDSIVITPR